MSRQLEHAFHLSVDQVAAHVERRLHGREREAVVAHLVECDECRREYVAAGRMVAASRPKWIALRSGIWLAAASVVVIAVVPRAFRSPRTAVTRDAATQRVAAPDVPASIRISSPADGQRLTSDAVRLTWRPDGTEALYRVTVQSVDGSDVWKSETYDTTVTLPRAVRLTEGATYYWSVDALHKDGRTARSAATAFTR